MLHIKLADEKLEIIVLKKKKVLFQTQAHLDRNKTSYRRFIQSFPNLLPASGKNNVYNLFTDGLTFLSLTAIHFLTNTIAFTSMCCSAEATIGDKASTVMIRKVPSFSLEAKRCEKVACVGEAKYHKKGLFAYFLHNSENVFVFHLCNRNEKKQIIEKEPNK
jgi:hypothetical protein